MTTPGLCGSCRNARVLENRAGSRFWLCGLAREDPRFPRYPTLPVLECPGYSPGTGADADDPRPPAER